MTKINSLIAVFFIVFFSSNAFCEDAAITDDEQSNQEQVNQQESPQEENVQETVLKIKDVSDINKASVVTVLVLNKITAKSYSYDIGVGKKAKFERLLIEPLFCWKSSPEDVAENKALLKITETKVDKTDSVVFYGWMFSSSPGISTLEHPMYDITVVDCK